MSKTESKRMATFRHELAKQTPKFPNDRATQKLLEQKTLTDNLVINMTWRVRFVSNRPRTVQIETSASSDPRWGTLKPGIDNLLKKVKAGDDLTPHLSSLVEKKGFTPGHAPARRKLNWSDKDLLLSATGFHHFHLGTTFQSKNRIKRTDEILFAAVSRDQFSVIGIFDHTVFDAATPNTMTSERARLWQAHEDFLVRMGSSIGGLGGTGISTSGHPTIVVLAAQKYFRLIRRIDSQLDDAQYIADIYKAARLPQPRKAGFTWALNYLDLGVVDVNGEFFRFESWPL